MVLYKLMHFVNLKPNSKYLNLKRNNYVNKMSGHKISKNKHTREPILRSNKYGRQQLAFTS